jgi:uncharacterized protein YrrD
MEERITRAGERFEVRPGARVVAANDELGRVERVVVSPGSGEVTGLVVRKGLLLRRDIVIPIEAVEDAIEELVRVRFTPNELNEFPEYHEEDFINPPADWQPPGGRWLEGILFRLPISFSLRRLWSARAGQTETVAGGKPIRAGQRVVCRDGDVGSLDLVLLDPVTLRATHFVVRRGSLLSRDRTVPVEWVREITHDRIFLDVILAELEQLPEYRSDDEITADVLNALWYGSDLSTANLQFVEVRTRDGIDGIVELNGHILTEQDRAVTERIARGVDGVLGVRNHLQSFQELARANQVAEHLRSGQSPIPENPDG